MATKVSPSTPPDVKAESAIKREDEPGEYHWLVMLGLLVAATVVLGLVIWGIMVATNKLDDDPDYRRNCDYPIVDASECSANAFNDHCLEYEDDCIETCENLYPLSISDPLCKYNEMCSSLGFHWSECDISQDDPIRNLDGIAVSLSNRSFDRGDDDSFELYYSLRYLGGFPISVQTPKTSFEEETVMHRIKTSGYLSWYIRLARLDTLDHCQFVSTRDPNIVLAHYGERIVAEYYDLSEGYPNSTLFTVTSNPDEDLDGYYIEGYETNNYLYIPTGENSSVLPTMIPLGEDHSGFTWFLSRNNTLGKESMEEFLKFLTIEEFNNVQSSPVSIGGCTDNYLRIDNNNVYIVKNIDVTFKPAYTIIELGNENDSSNMRILKTAIVVDDVARCIFAGDINSDKNKQVEKASNPDPKSENTVTYIKFTPHNKFIIGSPHHDTFVGLDNYSCSNANDDYVHLEWVDSINAIQFEFTRLY
jgi:hypothetical protein